MPPRTFDDETLNRLAKDTNLSRERVDAAQKIIRRVTELIEERRRYTDDIRQFTPELLPKLNLLFDGLLEIGRKADELVMLLAGTNMQDLATDNKQKIRDGIQALMRALRSKHFAHE